MVFIKNTNLVDKSKPFPRKGFSLNIILEQNFQIMRLYYKGLILLLLIMMNLTDAGAQDWSRKEYVDMYSDWAVNEMKRSGIPASITLAQGLLESNTEFSIIAVPEAT